LTEHRHQLPGLAEYRRHLIHDAARSPDDEVLDALTEKRAIARRDRQIVCMTA